MTTSSGAVSLLLLLSLLLSQAQGIRLEKVFISVRQQNNNIHKEENTVVKRSNIAAADLAGEPSNIASSGSTRKLISATSPSSATSTTTSKNEKNGREKRGGPEPKGENIKSTTPHGGKNGNVRAKSPVISKQQEAAAAHQHYPDLADMTEMDYSPARRKPPIHN